MVKQEMSEPGRVAPVFTCRHNPALLVKRDIHYLRLNIFHNETRAAARDGGCPGAFVSEPGRVGPVELCAYTD
jgi:hypothetical protein